MDAIKAALIYSNLFDMQQASWTCGKCGGISSAERRDSVAKLALSGDAWIKVMASGITNGVDPSSPKIRYLVAVDNMLTCKPTI